MAAASRIVKVFCAAEERAKLAETYEVVEGYDSFLLVRVSPSNAKTLAKKYPIEDITDQFTIRIGERKIKTTQPRVDIVGKTRSHAAYRGVKKLTPGKHHYIVQFVGPIKKNWLTRLKRAGAELRVPFTDFAYIVRCNQKVLKEIAGQPYVNWVGHLSHRDRLRIADQRQRLPRTKILRGVYTIEFFGKEDMRKAASKIRKLGLTILSKDEKACLIKVDIDVPGARAARLLDQLSAVHGVLAIREHALKRTSNDIAAEIMQTTKTLGNPLGLSGKGEIVAVCDTGFDTGDRRTIHEDFNGRIAAIKSYKITPTFDALINNPRGDDGSADYDSGHGTHVTGSVLGSGALSIGLPGQSKLVRGLAYEANLVFQAVEQELQWKNFQHELTYGRYLLAGIPDDLTELFQFAYTKGARVHSNSWGGGAAGEYDAQCYQLDEFVWKKKDFCVVVAAGNDGTDSDGDGRINPMSVTSPGTAKNCITVGASEGFRPQFNSETYGEWWPQDYPVSPYKNAPMANSRNQVVAFSSRGPTQDGRVKPDVIAPGTFILSTRSRKIPTSHTAWAPYPLSRNYFYMGGTSMATPLVSGAIALLRQFLREWVGYGSPSAALLKAGLMAGATKLSGYSSRMQVSDNAQGVGRVNLDAVVWPPAPIQVYFLDDRIGLQTGQTDEFTIRVRSSNHPFRVVMAYSDFPGSTLVNNLNLLLIDPRGRYYVGNSATTGQLQMDNRNNTEIAHVNRPRRGTWRLQVVASNVPRGPQDYALAMIGHISA